MRDLIGAFLFVSAGLAVVLLLAYLGWRSYWRYQADYWKRRSQALEDRIDALDAQICRLRGMRPLTQEEIERRNKQILTGEFHSEVKIG